MCRCRSAACALHKGARPHVVAIIGPPNSGKSTLFNRLTGLRQKVANFPRRHRGTAHGQGATCTTPSREVVLVDLPGVYSLNPRSEDEQVTHDVLTGAMPGIPKPDAVLLILDCTNLGRHLVLAAPILSLKLPTLVILNMADDLEEPRRPRRHRRTGQRARVAGGAHQRRQGPRRRQSLPVHGGHVGRHHLAHSLRAWNCPSCRTFRSAASGRTTSATGAAYHAPAPPIWTRRLDSDLSASHRRSADLPDRGRRQFSKPSSRRETFDGWPAGAHSDFRASGSSTSCPPIHLPLAAGGRHLERRRRRSSFSCRRFCCCSCSSEFWKTPAIWPAPL